MARDRRERDEWDEDLIRDLRLTHLGLCAAAVLCWLMSYALDSPMAGLWLAVLIALVPLVYTVLRVRGRRPATAAKMAYYLVFGAWLELSLRLLRYLLRAILTLIGYAF